MLKDEFLYKVMKLKESGCSDQEFLSLAKEFLIENDYRVFDPITLEESFKLSKYTDLVRYFYTMYTMLYAEELPRGQNPAADVKIASSFVKSRQSVLGSSVSKRRALAECALIIKTVILNKEAFHFTQPFGFWVFGTDTCRWITDKAIEIINKESGIIANDRLEQERDSFSRSLSDVDLKIDLDSKLIKVRSREV